jgi:hypothetical protein
VSVRKVPRPACLSDYFEKSNAVDIHNQMRQGILGLEENWVTHCGFFRIMCSIFGMCVIDTKEAMRHGLAKSHPLANASVKRVAGAIADDIFCRMNLTDETRPSYSIPALMSAVPGVVQMPSNRSSDASSVTTATSAIGSTHSCIVSAPQVGNPPGIPEYYRERHQQAETDQWGWQAGKHRKIRRLCVSCKTRTLFYCISCEKFFCKDGSGSTNQPRFCMWGHICSMFQESHLAGEDFFRMYADWQASLVD